MIKEELNNLFSVELELLKEIRLHEAAYMKNLKKMELSKEKLFKRNREGAKKAIEKMRLNEIKKAQEKIEKENLSLEDEMNRLKRSCRIFTGF